LAVLLRKDSPEDNVMLPVIKLPLDGAELDFIISQQTLITFDDSQN